MRYAEEVETQLRLKREQEAADMVEEESEEESEEEEEKAASSVPEDGKEKDGGNGAPSDEAGPSGQSAAQQEERDRLGNEFVEYMKVRFMAGEDGEFVNYAQIDADRSLDEAWAKEAAQDAEDAYFDDV